MLNNDLLKRLGAKPQVLEIVYNKKCIIKIMLNNDLLKRLGAKPLVLEIVYNKK